MNDILNIYDIYFDYMVSQLYPPDLQLNKAKVRKKAKFRNRYNQVPHLTWDTIWKSDKNTRKHHTQESQEVNPFLVGDHEAARNKQDRIAKTKN